MTEKPGTYSEQERHNWEVEKLKAECRNLGRSFWTAVALGLFAIVGTGANIYFSNNQKILSDNEKTLSEIKKEQLDREADALRKETDALKEEKDKLQAERTTIKQELLSIAPQLDEEKRKQVESLAAGIEVAPSTPASSTTSLPARVYLQYLRSQESKVSPVIAELRTRGYVVFPKAVESSARRGLFVGYYYETDKTEAAELLNVIRELGGTEGNAEPTFVKGGARQRHYDVWLSFPDA